VLRCARARLGLGAAMALLVLCACVPASSVGAVTIGSDLSATPTTFEMCFNGCTLRSNIPGRQVTSPIDGVIVRWRLKTKDGSPAGQFVKLRVIHPEGSPGQATGAGTGAPGAVATTAATTTYPTQLVIHAGDFIGVDLPTSSGVGALVSTSGAALDGWATPLLADGGPARSPSASPNLEGLWNADVEADADRDGFGDESQDACPGVAGPINGCPQADLSLTKAVTPNPSPVHGQFSFVVAVRNNGPSDLPAGFATVADTLPPSVTLLSATSPQASCASGNPVRCTVGALAVGATATIAVTVRPNGSGGIPNAATVSYGGDTNAANNTAGALATVLPPPTVSSANVSPKTFRLGSRLPKFSRRTSIGTTIRFKLTQPAKATLTFSQPKTGRRVGRRCVTLTRGNRKKRRCTIPNVRGTLSFNGHSGTNKVRFQGRLTRTRKLKPGRYTLTITATDSAGNRSNAKSTSFTIVR
jgi:uncharacterized repeat protein (TIGR01451 family)